VAIVERYEGVRRTCARYLDHYHFHVAEAASADQGLALIQTDRPAVMLIEDDASSRFEELRHKAASMGIPIVSMTTDLSDATRRTVGADAAIVLQKPFSLVTMLDEIRRVLRQTDVDAPADPPGEPTR
jgi:DNA-binding response OmpR family regulator